MSIYIDVGEDGVIVTIEEAPEFDENSDEIYVLSWVILQCVKYFTVGYPHKANDLMKLLNAITTSGKSIN
jgi:hypothetical protein